MDLTNGVSCIKGETHSLITLMRLNTRWATRSAVNKKFHKESSSTIGANFYYYDDEDPHIQSFRQLNEYLEGIYNINDVDCLKYITPFHNIIISEQANGALTSAALSSLSKFALYGFFQPHLPRIKEGLNLIINSISQCVFEETDRENDDIILMKLLELSSLIFRCQASSLLTSENAWDVYSTCLSIYSHTKASKVLKSEAETTLVHLTLNIFTRVSTLITNSNETDTEYPPSNSKNSLLLTSKSDLNLKNTSISSSSSIVSSDDLYISNFSGLTHLSLRIIRELSKKLQDKDEIQLGLFLINVALEAGGVALNSIKELIEILRNDVCRYLLRATQSEDLKVFSSSLRVVFNLFMSIKEHMKVQLEVFLTSVHLRLLNNYVGNISAREELALESLLEFCREPLLMQDLYANYDCDVQCTNIFDSIISTLAKRSIVDIGIVPESYLNNSSLRKVFIHNSSSNLKIDRSLLYNIDAKSRIQLQLEKSRYLPRVTVLHRLAFDGILAILKSIVLKCSTIDSMILNQIEDKKPVESKNKKLSLESDSEDYELENESYSSYDELEISNISTYKEENDESLQLNDLPLLLPPISSITPTSSIAWNQSNAKKFLWNQNLSPSTRESLTTIEELRQKKQIKQRLRLIAEAFNQSPLKIKWMTLALEANLLYKLTDEDLEKNEVDLERIEKELSSHSLSSNTTTINQLNKERDQIKLLQAAYKQSITSYCSIHPSSLAQFLRETPGLNREEIGVFISQGPSDRYPFHAIVLKSFLNTFTFEDVPFGAALRMFLSSFRLPGEAQCIDRIMEAFAHRYFEFVKLKNKDGSLDEGEKSSEPTFASADAVFILAFSTILLNTDLHNPQIPASKKMSKEDFIKNNRGINDGKNLSREFLISVYEEIKANQIQVLSDSKAVTDFSDPEMWHKLVAPKNASTLASSASTALASNAFSNNSTLNNSLLNDLPHFQSTFSSVRNRNSFSLPLSLPQNYINPTESIFTPQPTSEDHQKNQDLISNSEKIDISDLLEYEIDMFLVISKRVFETNLILLENINDDTMLKRIFQSIYLYLFLCNRLELNQHVNSSLSVLLYRLFTSILLLNDFYVANLNSLTFSPAYFSSTRGKYDIISNQVVYNQWRNDEGYDLYSLLTSSISSLFGSDYSIFSSFLFISSTISTSSSLISSNISQNDQAQLDSSSNTATSHPASNTPALISSPNSPPISEFVDWSEASMVKFHLLLNILLKVMTDFHLNIRSLGWNSLLAGLLYARSRGALPSELSKLENTFGGNIIEEKEDNPSVNTDDKLKKSSKNKIIKNEKGLPKESILPTSISKNSFFLSLNSYFRQGDLNTFFSSVQVNSLSSNPQSSSVPSSLSQSTSVSSSTSPTNRTKSSSNSNNWNLFSIGDFLWSSSNDNFDDETLKVREKAKYLYDLKNLSSSAMSSEEKLLFFDTSFSPLVTSSSNSKNFLRTDDSFLSTTLNNNLKFLLCLKNSSSIPFDDSSLFLSLLETLQSILTSFQLSSSILDEWCSSLNDQEELKNRESNNSQGTSSFNETFPLNLIPPQIKFFHNVNELDAVLVLEWIFNHLLLSPSVNYITSTHRIDWFIKFLRSSHITCTSITNNTSTSPLPPTLLASSTSASFDGELKDSNSRSFIEELSIKLPFFLERCIVLLFRLSLNELSSERDSLSPFSIPITSNLLHIINSLSSTYLQQLSSLIGTGLITFIQYLHQLNIKLLKNEWQVFFDILLKLMNYYEGREKIWQIISIILMEDLINRENYDEIKKILIKFITYSKLNEEIINKKEHEEWSLKSLLYLLRLCLIRLASYAYFNSIEFISNSSLLNDNSNFEGKNDIYAYIDPSKKIYGYITFPDPFEAKKGAIATLSSSNSDPSSRSNQASSSTTSWLTVPIIPLETDSLSDFSLSLWVTSIVLFSDLCNSSSLRLIHRSLYCLEVSILAARYLETGNIIVKKKLEKKVDKKSEIKSEIKSDSKNEKKRLENLKLSNELWYKILQELLVRLPLNLTQTYNKLQKFSFNLIEISEISYCSCNLLIKILLDLHGNVKNLSNFNEFYLKLVNFLIVNASVSMKGSILYDEMLHMIISMLKILYLPPILITISTTSATTFIITSATSSSLTSPTSTSTSISTVGSSSTYNLSSINLSNLTSHNNATSPVKTHSINSSPSTSKTVPKVEQKSSYFNVLSWINPFSSSSSALPSTPSTQTAPSSAASSYKESLTNSELKSHNTIDREETLTPSTSTSVFSLTPQQYNDLFHNDAELLVLAWRSILSVYPSSSSIIRNWDPSLHKSILTIVELVESGKLNKILKILASINIKEIEKEKEKEKEREYRENFKENFNKKILEKKKNFEFQNPTNSDSLSLNTDHGNSSNSSSLDISSTSLSSEPTVAISNISSPSSTSSNTNNFTSSPPPSIPIPSSFPITSTSIINNSSTPINNSSKLDLSTQYIPSPSQQSNFTETSPLSSTSLILQTPPIKEALVATSPTSSPSFIPSLSYPSSVSSSSDSQISPDSNVTMLASNSNLPSNVLSTTSSPSSSSSTPHSSPLYPTMTNSNEIEPTSPLPSTTTDRPKVASTNIIIKKKYFDATSPIQIV